MEDDEDVADRDFFFFAFADAIPVRLPNLFRCCVKRFVSNMNGFSEARGNLAT